MEPSLDEELRQAARIDATRNRMSDIGLTACLRATHEVVANVPFRFIKATKRAGGERDIDCGIDISACVFSQPDTRA